MFGFVNWLFVSFFTPNVHYLSVHFNHLFPVNHVMVTQSTLAHDMMAAWLTDYFIFPIHKLPQAI